MTTTEPDTDLDPCIALAEVLRASVTEGVGFYAYAFEVLYVLALSEGDALLDALQVLTGLEHTATAPTREWAAGVLSEWVRVTARAAA